MSVGHGRFLRRQHHIPVAVFPNQKGDWYVPGVKHLRHLHTDQPASHDDGALQALAEMLHILQVLVAVQATYPFKVLPGPAKFIGRRAGGQQEFVINQLLPLAAQERFCIKINAFDIGIEQLNSVFVPKPVLVRLGIFVAHVPHIDIHERSTGEKVIRFGRYHSNVMIAEFADKASGSDAGNTVSEDDYMHRVRLISLLAENITKKPIVAP